MANRSTTTSTSNKAYIKSIVSYPWEKGVEGIFYHYSTEEGERRDILTKDTIAFAVVLVMTIIFIALILGM
jgi:hypothetical protein